ncbi:SDR family NAD(P)-dependent oxidoreductase [Herbiconiux sp.]|uniref:SDR family NAD(P)-dependent oxidoreductase n=1 Tax=Herbiconiux sp. TaxID=1871186 RepID=UPI0025C1449F|nr:SDR family NAD(P)-dependent oxidoreductase [Herbiconiux sp.]
MPTQRVALVTEATHGVGKQVARQLASGGAAVFIGSRLFARGAAAAAEIGFDAVAVELDVAEPESIAAAAELIAGETGRLDILINNATLPSAEARHGDIAGLRPAFTSGTASLDEIRAVWEVNVLGPLAVYRAMLPLMRASDDARIVNVTCALDSMTTISDPAFAYRSTFEPVSAASKTALDAVTFAMMKELTGTRIKVNHVSPGFGNADLGDFEAAESIQDAAREVVRVARLGPTWPSGTFEARERVSLSW